VFFVSVANKGLTGAMSVKMAAKGLKMACFDSFGRWFVRVANKGVSRARGESRVQARWRRKLWRGEVAAGEKRALRLESIENGSMD
jgi:hypothetical protein